MTSLLLAARFGSLKSLHHSTRPRTIPIYITMEADITDLRPALANTLMLKSLGIYKITSVAWGVMALGDGIG